jgi:hypothetical protein
VPRVTPSDVIGIAAARCQPSRPAFSSTPGAFSACQYS